MDLRQLRRPSCRLLFPLLSLTLLHYHRRLIALRCLSFHEKVRHVAVMPSCTMIQLKIGSRQPQARLQQTLVVYSERLSSENFPSNRQQLVEELLDHPVVVILTAVLEEIRRRVEGIMPLSYRPSPRQRLREAGNRGYTPASNMLQTRRAGGNRTANRQSTRRPLSVHLSVGSSVLPD